MDIFSNILFVLVSPNSSNMKRTSSILFLQEDYHALASLAQKCIEIEKYRFETCIVVGKIISANNSLVTVVFLLGNFYSIRNDHARAIQYFTRALRMNPDYPAAWILLGHEFVEGKNHAAAINAYREALGIVHRLIRKILHISFRSKSSRSSCLVWSW